MWGSCSDLFVCPIRSEPETRERAVDTPAASCGASSSVPRTDRQGKRVEQLEQATVGEHVAAAHDYRHALSMPSRYG